MVADQGNEPSGRAQPLEGADQHAQPGRVEEVHPAQVDDHLSGAGVDQLDEPLPQPGCGVDVDLATDLEHRGSPTVRVASDSSIESSSEPPQRSAGI